MKLSKYLKPIDDWVILDDYINSTEQTKNTIYSMLTRLKKSDPNEWAKVRDIRDGRLWLNYGRLVGYNERLKHEAQKIYEYLMYDKNLFKSDYALAVVVWRQYPTHDRPTINGVLKHLQKLYTSGTVHNRGGLTKFFDALYTLSEKLKERGNNE